MSYLIPVFKRNVIISLSRTCLSRCIYIQSFLHMILIICTSNLLLSPDIEELQYIIQTFMD